MPQHISSEHLARMFPFAFYDELSENLKGFTLTNPAFILRDTLKWDKDKRKQIYEESQATNAITTLHGHNIIEVEPFGHVLILDICCNDNYIETLINNIDERSQIPLSILVAQLYDSSNQPIFASDVSEASIAKIPEILWDDPNLLLAVVTFSEKETQVGVLKIPKQIEALLFEPITTNESITHCTRCGKEIGYTSEDPDNNVCRDCYDQIRRV